MQLTHIFLSITLILQSCNTWKRSNDSSKSTWDPDKYNDSRPRIVDKPESINRGKEEELKGAPYLFHLASPKGLTLFSSMLNWSYDQVKCPDYTIKTTCAFNTSRVFRDAGLAHYNSLAVAGILDIFKKNNSSIFAISNDHKGRRLNKSKTIDKLNKIYGGHIPVGTAVAGCLYSNCWSGASGERHVGLLGDTIWYTPHGETEPKETLLVYHNNWLRPENKAMGESVDKAIKEDLWNNHPVGDMLISKQYYINKAFNKEDRRQWMPTRWLYIKRDSDGKILDIESATPQIDDLDPFNYFVYLVIPKEIENEIKNDLGISRIQKSPSDVVTTEAFTKNTALSLRESRLNLQSDDWPEINAVLEKIEDRK